MKAGFSHSLIIAAALSVWLCMSSCNKHREELHPVRKVETGTHMRVNDIWINQDTMWVCGGIRGNRGHILFTTDQGETWVNCLTLDSKSIYTIERDSSGVFWAGSEFLSIWRSSDGQHWTELWLGDQVPFHEEDRPAIRQFQFGSNNSVFFAGGENLGEGVLYQSEDGGQNWEFIFQQHEFRDILIDQSTGIACGHGEIRSFNGDLQNSYPTQPENDFYTGVTSHSDGYIICSSGGVILESEDGISWHEWAKAPPDLNFTFNDISTNGENISACGMKGAWWSFRNGSWKAYEVEDEPNLYQLCPAGEGFWAGSDNGTIYYFE